ncbi:HAD family hydrolase [Azospirillum ramasamyi]|uniref:Haloacid dehalogenase-like hydrolase n=1 Tax=Azospirillum ramasamyi TaxID=682998 RepID=A0A2U9S5G0_9PROT|nr:HAD family hydrolase [Azospirillum ramasamyi]AWU94592.1 haloacid dehalogenase-like hydrolase [Azospirillum ramasamyi]
MQTSSIPDPALGASPTPPALLPTQHLEMPASDSPAFDSPVCGPSGVAFFDFDGTLIHGDSLPMFVGEVIGRRRAALALADAIRSAMHRHVRGRGPGCDFPGSVKAIYLKRTLRGLPVAEALAASERMVPRVRWHQPMLEVLKEHRRQGRRVVVATGALDLYMPALLRGLEVDDLLATGMEVVDGKLTGRLSTANCVRLDKAERVTAWIAGNGPVAATWGYGNHPSDLPMLALMHKGEVIRIRRRSNRR